MFVRNPEQDQALIDNRQKPWSGPGIVSLCSVVYADGRWHKQVFQVFLMFCVLPSREMNANNVVPAGFKCQILVCGQQIPSVNTSVPCPLPIVPLSIMPLGQR